MLQTLPKTAISTGPWSLLQARLQGAVIAPEDPRYDEARRAWNLNVDQRPASTLSPWKSIPTWPF